MVLKMVTQGRQGDVYIINEKDTKLRSDTKKRLFGGKFTTKLDFKKEKRIPLAYGEVSGHAHAIYDNGVAELTYSKDVQETLKHLEVSGSAVVTHEEHKAMQIAEGKNAVLIQNEWTGTKIRRVAD